MFVLIMENKTIIPPFPEVLGDYSNRNPKTNFEELITLIKMLTFVVGKDNSIAAYEKWYDIFVSQYFNGNEMIKTKVNGEPSPLEIWNNNYIEIIEYAGHSNKPYYEACHDWIWKKTKFARTFKVEWVIGSVLQVIDWIRLSNELKPITEMISDKENVTEILSDFKVFDPFSGWGDRLTGCAALGVQYIGVDANVNLVNGYSEMLELFREFGYDKAQMNCMPIEEYNHVGESCDMVITSPPFFNKEEYTNDETQSNIKYPTLSKWILFMKNTFKKCFEIVKPGGYVCIYMSDAGMKHKYVNELLNYVKSLKYMTNGKYQIIKLNNLAGFGWPMYVWQKIL